MIVYAIKFKGMRKSGRPKFAGGSTISQNPVIQSDTVVGIGFSVVPTDHSDGSDRTHNICSRKCDINVFYSRDCVATDSYLTIQRRIRNWSDKDGHIVRSDVCIQNLVIWAGEKAKVKIIFLFERSISNKLSRSLRSAIVRERDVILVDNRSLGLSRDI